MNLGTWIVDYLNQLRPEIRADTADRRLQDAARLAIESGWAPGIAAEQVNAGNYTTARNPPIIAIIELERLADRTPPAEHPTLGCADCFHGWMDTLDEPTRPCPTCRPQLAARLRAIPPPGQRTQDHIHYLRYQRTMR